MQKIARHSDDLKAHFDYFEAVTTGTNLDEKVRRFYRSKCRGKYELDAAEFTLEALLVNAIKVTVSKTCRLPNSHVYHNRFVTSQQIHKGLFIEAVSELIGVNFTATDKAVLSKMLWVCLATQKHLESQEIYGDTRDAERLAMIQLGAKDVRENSIKAMQKYNEKIISVLDNHQVKCSDAKRDLVDFEGMLGFRDFSYWKGTDIKAGFEKFSADMRSVSSSSRYSYLTGDEMKMMIKVIYWCQRMNNFDRLLKSRTPIRRFAEEILNVKKINLDTTVTVTVHNVQPFVQFLRADAGSTINFADFKHAVIPSMFGDWEPSTKTIKRALNITKESGQSVKKMDFDFYHLQDMIAHVRKSKKLRAQWAYLSAKALFWHLNQDRLEREGRYMRYLTPSAEMPEPLQVIIQLD